MIINAKMFQAAKEFIAFKIASQLQFNMENHCAKNFYVLSTFEVCTNWYL